MLLPFFMDYENYPYVVLMIFIFFVVSENSGAFLQPDNGRKNSHVTLIMRRQLEKSLSLLCGRTQPSSYKKKNDY